MYSLIIQNPETKIGSVVLESSDFTVITDRLEALLNFGAYSSGLIVEILLDGNLFAPGTALGQRLF